MSQFRVLTTIFTIVCALNIALSKRKSSSDGGMFDCMMCQLCICEDAGDLGKCWDLFTDETQQHFVDSLNACKLGSSGLHIEMPFISIAQEICNYNLDEWENCFHNLSESLKNHIKESAKDNLKKHVSSAIEAARMCIGPNVMSCKMFGTETC